MSDLHNSIEPSVASRPGMMGDGTEEQNLNQPGDPTARVTEEDVKIAFGEGAPSSLPSRAEKYISGLTSTDSQVIIGVAGAVAVGIAWFLSTQIKKAREDVTSRVKPTADNAGPEFARHVAGPVE